MVELSPVIVGKSFVIRDLPDTDFDRTFIWNMVRFFVIVLGVFGGAAGTSITTSFVSFDDIFGVKLCLKAKTIFDPVVVQKEIVSLEVLEIEIRVEKNPYFLVFKN